MTALVIRDGKLYADRMIRRMGSVPIKKTKIDILSSGKMVCMVSGDRVTQKKLQEIYEGVCKSIDEGIESLEGLPTAVGYVIHNDVIHAFKTEDTDIYVFDDLGAICFNGSGGDVLMALLDLYGYDSVGAKKAFERLPAHDPMCTSEYDIVDIKDIPSFGELLC